MRLQVISKYKRTGYTIRATHKIFNTKYSFIIGLFIQKRWKLRFPMIRILYDKFSDRWIYIRWIKQETMVI